MLESIWVTVMSFATLDLRLVLMSWGPWCCLGLCGSTDSTDTPCVQNCADPKKLAPDPLAMHITPKPWQHLHCIYIEMEDNIRQPSVYMGQKQRAPDMFGNGVSQCFCTGHMNSAVSESANVSRTWNPWLNHLWLLQPWHSLTVSHGRCGSLWDGVAEAPEPCCEAQCSTRKILHKFLQVSSWSYVCGIVGHLVQVPRTMWRSLVSHLSLWPIGWLKLFFFLLPTWLRNLPRSCIPCSLTKALLDTDELDEVPQIKLWKNRQGFGRPRNKYTKSLPAA